MEIQFRKRNPRDKKMSRNLKTAFDSVSVPSPLVGTPSISLDNSFRILTFNINGRPVELADSLSKESACDPEYHLFNSQQKRMRSFFEWLDEFPLLIDIICLQEVMWKPMIVIAREEMKKRGYTTHKDIDLMSDLGSSSSLGFLISSFSLPEAGSGLAIYVRSGLQILRSGKETFEKRIGVDHLAQKGLKWAIVLNEKKETIGVLTTHPQAYQDIPERPKTGLIGTESIMGSMARNFGIKEMQLLGGYPWAITYVHSLQFKQIRNTIEELISENPDLKGMFVAGDMNVNRYPTKPDSEEEKDLLNAFQENKISKEFVWMLKDLNCTHPPIKANPFAPFGGKFTWDGLNNTMAHPLNNSRGALSWIDYILYFNGLKTKPKYMDNQCVPILSKVSFPELAPLWSFDCVLTRDKLIKKQSGVLDPLLKKRLNAYQVINQKSRDSYQKGQDQLLYLQKSFASQKLSEDKWGPFLQKAPFSISSQIWKGLEFYGYQKEDKDVQRLQAHKFKVGSPHPFRMQTEVSDHYAVLSTIVL